MRILYIVTVIFLLQMGFGVKLYAINPTTNGIFYKNEIIVQNDSDEIMKVATKCYEIYMSGVSAEDKGDTISAQNLYNKFLSVENRPIEISEIELDVLARSIEFAYSKKNWDSICYYSQIAINISPDVLEQYKNTEWIYSMYIHALNMLNKCVGIDSIIEQGLKYADKMYQPTEKEYYELRFEKIISYINRYQYDLAKKYLENISVINATKGNHIVDEEIAFFSAHLQECENLYQNKAEEADTLIRLGVELLIGAHSFEDKGAHVWELLLSQINNFLNLSYFDIHSVEDEKLWTRLVYYYHVFVNSFCEVLNIDGREGFAYDYVLTSKNFLDWHSQRVYKKEVKWQEIKESLENDEVAIEIVPYAKEALILKNSYDVPKIAPLDSIILKTIETYNNSDPYEINEYYRLGGPLHKLFMQIEPYITGCKRMYISGSNNLAQFNYGAIPYKNTTLDDAYEVIQMVTTADIPQFKLRNTDFTYDMVALFGGIDYNIVDTLNITSNHKDSQWAYHDNIPSEMRSGYGYLPYSLSEVQKIGEICNKYDIKHSLFTGAEASEQSIKELQLGKSSILHIATHSFLLPNYSFQELNNMSIDTGTSRMGTVMSNTGLLFAGVNQYLEQGKYISHDGLLTAKEISECDLSCVKLATLSCCSSALGDLSNINGIVYGLVSALKTSGVNQVLVSLWDIPDYTTSIFMQQFYDNLLQGIEPNECLKKARKALISFGYTDPYYWTPFVILN